jgi:hypothetical protein
MAYLKPAIGTPDATGRALKVVSAGQQKGPGWKLGACPGALNAPLAF